MADEFEGVKVLASRATAERITRRHFLAGSAVAVFSSSVLLAACGDDNPAPERRRESRRRAARSRTG